MPWTEARSGHGLFRPRPTPADRTGVPVTCRRPGPRPGAASGPAGRSAHPRSQDRTEPRRRPVSATGRAGCCGPGRIGPDGCTTRPRCAAKASPSRNSGGRCSAISAAASTTPRHTPLSRAWSPTGRPAGQPDAGQVPTSSSPDRPPTDHPLVGPPGRHVPTSIVNQVVRATGLTDVELECHPRTTESGPAARRPRGQDAQSGPSCLPRPRRRGSTRIRRRSQRWAGPGSPLPWRR